MGKPMRLGVDTGGTFTDFVLVEPDGTLRTHKCPSPPTAPERAIIEGIAALGLDPMGLGVVHGSTVATNAVLEGKGAHTAFITSHGFGDMLTIGRQARERLYDLQPPLPLPPVAPELCIETGGRVMPTGEVLEPLTDTDLEAVRGRIVALAPEAVAINLLFSFVDDTAERRLEAVMPEGVFVSRSSAVLPEYREYERGIATWLNARVGPVMRDYLTRLAEGLPGARVSVMQSSAGTVQAGQAVSRAIHLLLSGPAGGVLAADWLGRRTGMKRLLTFDMGGTSTDVALVMDGPALTGEGRVAGFPVAVPMVDIHTIGAGGGSIAWCDAGGLLQVGPHSAGADPGPACYGRGGTEATVTDAHVVLGHLPVNLPLAGMLKPDAHAAHAAIQSLAARLGLGVEATARGILRIADEHMAQALRVMSVGRGEDPRDYTLFPFGGAGGLHVCSLAERLGMKHALFPMNAGVLSALGMLVARPARVGSRTMICCMNDLEVLAAIEVMNRLEEGARTELSGEGMPEATLEVMRTADLRYTGQSHVIEVDWDADPHRVMEAFHAAHERRYGHRLDLPVELVNLRVRVAGPEPDVRLPEREGGPARPPLSHARVLGIGDHVPVHEAAGLVPGQRLEGPAIVAGVDSTLWLAPGWRAEVDRYGNLALAS